MRTLGVERSSEKISYVLIPFFTNILAVKKLIQFKIKFIRFGNNIIALFTVSHTYCTYYIEHTKNTEYINMKFKDMSRWF